MARPREFDVETALDSAMQVFWSKGYETASLDDLCEATGLSRSSLYATFGDKRNLLLESLSHYVQKGDERIGNALLRKIPFRDALSDLLHDFIDAIVAGPGRRGCFIGNCAAEIARQDRTAMAHIRDALACNEAFFRAGLIAGKKRGELPSDADVVALARFLTASIQGLRLVGKANPDRAALEDIAMVMLRCLDR
jgi:TetR/AcrR family transcriptional repressor of nem operon